MRPGVRHAYLTTLIITGTIRGLNMDRPFYATGTFLPFCSQHHNTASKTRQLKPTNWPEYDALMTFHIMCVCVQMHLTSRVCWSSSWSQPTCFEKSQRFKHWIKVIPFDNSLFLCVLLLLFLIRRGTCSGSSRRSFQSPSQQNPLKSTSRELPDSRSILTWCCIKPKTDHLQESKQIPMIWDNPNRSGILTQRLTKTMNATFRGECVKMSALLLILPPWYHHLLALPLSSVRPSPHRPRLLCRCVRSCRSPLLLLFNHYHPSLPPSSALCPLLPLLLPFILLNLYPPNFILSRPPFVPSLLLSLPEVGRAGSTVAFVGRASTIKVPVLGVLNPLTPEL